MELSGCSQSHYIAVIRGGDIIRVPNIARGKKGLKFSSIEEIYFSNDSKCPDACIEHPPKVHRSLAVKTEVKSEYIEDESQLDFETVTLRQLKDVYKSLKRKASRSVNLTTVKQEDSEPQCEGDELDLEETLGSWKRKVLIKTKAQKKHISSMSSKTKHLSGRLKVKPANLALSDISNEICKPLNIKVEDEHEISKFQARSLSVSDDPGNFTGDTVGSFEPCCQDKTLSTTSGILQSGGLDQVPHEHSMMPASIGKSLCNLNQVSYEHLAYAEPCNPPTSEIPKIPEMEEIHEISQPQSRSLTVGDDRWNFTNDALGAFEPRCSDKYLNITSGSLQSGCPDQFPHEHSVMLTSIGKSICSLNQVSYEHLACAEPQNQPTFEILELEAMIKLESSVVKGEQSFVFKDSEVRNREDMIDFMACDEPKKSIILEGDNCGILNGYLQYPCPFQPPTPDGDTSSEVHVPRMAPLSDCQNVEFTNAGKAINSMDNDKGIEELVRRDATICNPIVKLDNCLPSVDSMPSLDSAISAVETKQLPVLDATIEEVVASPMGPKSNCQDTKIFENHEASRSTDDNPDTEALAKRDSKNYNVAEDENFMPLDNGVESLLNVTSAVEDKQPSIFKTVIAPLTCSPEVQPCNAVDQHFGTAETERVYENKLEQQPPERLFSARKTISPNSKERLCRAIFSADVQDDTQILSCREKLFSKKNCVDTSTSRSNVKKARIIITSKRLEPLHATDIRASGMQTLKKGKSERKPCLKSAVNGPRVSPSVQAASACSSAKRCSENAIAFSQQQMVDIERLAAKLLTELHSMKEIVVDTLHSDSRICATSRYNTDKARIAVENVKKVEETTKRWLSMMSRDCHRFRKIMELSEMNHVSPLKSSDDYIPDIESCQENSASDTKQ